jgi:glycosyltransferase involved in cell wall biosynthesis
MISPYWAPFYEGLAELGWRLTVLVSSLREDNREHSLSFMDRLQAAGITLGELEGSVVDLTSLGVRTDFLQVPVALGDALAATSPDLVVSNQLGLRTWMAGRWGRRSGVPVVPWVNASRSTETSNSPVREHVRRRLLASAPAVFTNGTEARGYLEGSLGVAPARIVEVPYAVPADAWVAALGSVRADSERLRSAIAPEGDTLVLLYVGQVIPRKGLAELLAGLDLLPPEGKKRLRLCVVGGEATPELATAAERAGVRVHWEGFVQPEDLPAWYGMADALVLPSLEDEWGIVLNEGAASGLPLLASRLAGATPDLVRDGRNGYVFDPLTPADVASAAGRLLALDPADRAHMADASRAVARERDMSHTIAAADAALGGLLRAGGGMDR